MILAVPEHNPRFDQIRAIEDVPPHTRREIEHFFNIYKDLEGKRVEVKEWHDAGYARDRVARAIKMFAESKAKKLEANQTAAV